MLDKEIGVEGEKWKTMEGGKEGGGGEGSRGRRERMGGGKEEEDKEEEWEEGGGGENRERRKEEGRGRECNIKVDTFAQSSTCASCRHSTAKLRVSSLKTKSSATANTATTSWRGGEQEIYQQKFTC